MLFSDLSEAGVDQDIATVLTFITGYCAQFRVPDHQIDVQKVREIVHGMRHDFPHDGGVEPASPFKKAANFVCYFVAARPVATPLPGDVADPDLLRIDNYINALLALTIAIESLDGATVTWQCDGSEHVLRHRIRLSRHSLVDIVDALSTATPVSAFKLVSVLLEQMVYKTNPDCQYPIPD